MKKCKDQKNIVGNSINRLDQSVYNFAKYTTVKWVDIVGHV